MTSEHGARIEAIQRMVTRTVATHPAGRNVVLIGGFRYRFLDESVRSSDDIDYHWPGDLDEKQRELVALFSRTLLPEVRRRFRHEGRAAPRSGPDVDSPVVRTVDLAFWQDAVAYSRIEIPVELTRIVCADPIIVRTAGGTVYQTASDGDMIESKIVAIVNRTVLRHRDIVDLFLFQNRLLPDSGRRIAAKLRTLKIPHSAILTVVADLLKHKDYHAKAVQAVLDTQVDAAAAAHLNDAGGGMMVLDAALQLLSKNVATEPEALHESD